MHDFPFVVDSTMLATYKACPQKFFRYYVEHWKPGEESIHLVAGRAFATGVEITRRAFYTEGQSPARALALGIRALWREYGSTTAPEDSPKSAIRMAGALEYYFSEYPLGADGATPHFFGSSHGIEFSFVEPLSVLHPQSGDPILFSGRADMVADAFGGLFLFDEKTTSQLGPTWVKKWDHRSQFTAYCWGLRGHGINPTGVVVRGAAIYQDGYGTQQAITYRSNWEIDRWLEATEAAVRAMILTWQEWQRTRDANLWQHNLDDACIAYGGCALQTACKSPEPERWIKMSFTRRKWDPVTRTEIPLE